MSQRASRQVSRGLLVSEVAAVSPSLCSLSLALSFPIVVGGCMVLQAVEVSQITKHSKSFVPVISSTCCAVKFDHCKMILFAFDFPVQIPQLLEFEWS